MTTCTDWLLETSLYAFKAFPFNILKKKLKKNSIAQTKSQGFGKFYLLLTKQLYFITSTLFYGQNFVSFAQER